MLIGVKQMEMNYQFIADKGVEMCIFRLIRQMGLSCFYSLN